MFVPWCWPSNSSEHLQLVQISCPELAADAAAAVMDSINSNVQLLEGCDLLGMLRAVAEAADARLLDAASL